jgi:hypothetical protein
METIERIANTHKNLTAAIIFATSVSLTLVGILALAGWAETSVVHHAIQHVIIFVAGCGAGSSLLNVLTHKKDV